MFVELDTIVVCDLLKLVHASFKFTKMFLLASFQLISLIYGVTKVVNLLLKESKSLSTIIDSGCILLKHLFSPFSQHLIHSSLTLHLFVMQRQQQFFIIFNLFLSRPDVFLKIYKKIRGLHLFEPLLDPHMLLYQVLYGFIRILYLFLSRLNLLRPGSLWVSGWSDSPTVYDRDSFFLKWLLIHFIDEEIDIFTHFFELIT